MATAQRVFLDSNILVYAHSATDPARRERARTLADLPGATLSTQVLGELASVLLRKFRLPEAQVRDRVTEIARRCDIVSVTPAIVLDALRIRERFRLGFFDSQIIAAALAVDANTLYSEDLHRGLLVDGSLRIVDPFRSGVAQPERRYRARRMARKPARRTA